MHNAFFSSKFSKCMGYFLAQRIFNIYAIFCGFSDVKNGEPSQQPSLISQLVSDEPQREAKLNEAYFFI